MAIKVGKLWGRGSFQSLSKEAKLLYVYLITAPELDILGLLNLSPVRIQLDLGIDEETLKTACKELLDNYITIYKNNKEIYFFIAGHFATFPSSDAVSKRAQKAIERIPEKILDGLVSDGLMPNIQHVSEWVEPTPQEVLDYSISQGYIIDPEEFIGFYRGKAKELGKSNWYDGRGKQVKDWKGKLRKVWFRNAQKLEPAEHAPEGYEYFYVEDNGKYHFANQWAHGKPLGGSLAIDVLLREKFNELQKQS